MKNNISRENIERIIESTKLNNRFLDSSVDPIFLIGENNINGVFEEFGEIFTDKDSLENYQDVLKREFSFFIKKIKDNNFGEDEKVKTFIERIPNPAIREIVDSYVNQRPSMLFTLKDENDTENAGHLFISEQKSENGDYFILSNQILSDENSIGYLDLIKSYRGKLENCWSVSEGAVEQDVLETYYLFNVNNNPNPDTNN